MKRRHFSIIPVLKRIAVVIVSIVLLSAFIGFANPEVEASENMTDATGTIRYEYVNMRQNPSTGAKIVDVLYQGTTVSFTGNYIDYFLNDIYPLWVEVEVDGHTGWIVIESVSGFKR